MAAAARPRIVALEPVANDPMMVRVRIGQAGSTGTREVARLSRPRCEELGLRVEQAWTLALQRRVQALAERDAARDAGLRRLGRSGLSARGLEAALQRAGHAPDAVRQAVTDLTSAGWLDDGAFAEQRAQKLASGAPIATEAVSARLEAEGIEPDLALKAAKRAVPSTPARALADEARAAKRLGKRASTVAARMARRGFDQETVLAALRTAGYAVDDE
jgi:SOS response regulatory protein OraA/RecX